MHFHRIMQASIVIDSTIPYIIQGMNISPLLLYNSIAHVARYVKGSC